MKTVTADHEAGYCHRMENSLLQKSKERRITTRMKQKRDGTEAREEGSLIEVNRNEWALRYEKLGAQTRERGMEEGDVSATLPHS